MLQTQLLFSTISHTNRAIMSILRLSPNGTNRVTVFEGNLIRYNRAHHQEICCYLYKLS